MPQPDVGWRLDPFRLLRREQQEEDKLAVINVLTNGEGTCRWCGQGDIDVLCVDHINDDGGARYRGNIYKSLITHDYAGSECLQVLCASCNLKKEVERRRRKWAILQEDYAIHGV